MKRFWASWYSKSEVEDVPFDCWITGETMDEPPYFTYVGTIDAENEEDVFKQVAVLYPDWKRRFCNEKESDWQPSSDRFTRGL